jgi:hypothetical protein
MKIPDVTSPFGAEPKQMVPGPGRVGSLERKETAIYSAVHTGTKRVASQARGSEQGLPETTLPE